MNIETTVLSINANENSTNFGLNFTDWVIENQQDIVFALVDKATNFLFEHSQGNFSGQPSLDNTWHYIQMSGKDKGKVGYCGAISYSSKNVPQLSLTLNHFRDGSIIFKDSVVADMWTTYKALFQSPSNHTNSWTVQQSINDYQSADLAGSSPYLHQKQVQPHNMTNFNGIGFDGSKILVPLFDIKGNIQAAQKIYPNGQKLYPSGQGWKNGLFYPIGEDFRHAKKIAITAGLTTGLSVYQSGACACVINALDDNNIKHVVKLLREKNLQAEIILVADNDHLKKSNSGITTAQKVSQQFQVSWTYPYFDDSDKGTDFNDLQVTDGVAAVLEQFKNNITKPEKSAAKPFCTKDNVAKTPFVQESVTKEADDNKEDLPFCDFCGIKTPFRFFEQKTKTQEITENMLPTNIRGWIMDVAKRMQTYPTFSAAAAISFVSAIIARRVNLTPKRYDKQWVVYPNVWGAIVGKAGSQKSPSITPMFEPIRKHNKKMLDLHKIELENWEYEVEQCKKEKRDASEYPVKPTRESLFTNDATPEALQKIHQDNPQGVLLYRDELSGFIDQMTKQGREGARQFFLEGWSGDGAFSYDTISRGNTYIDGLCLTLFGSIQPSILAKQVENDRNGTGADGFIQRFQLLVKSNPKPNYSLAISDVEPDYAAKQLYEDTLERLLNLPTNDTPVTVNFDNQAQEIFDSWYEVLENRLRSQKMPDMLASHLSKYRSLMPSLALIFEAINNELFHADTLSSDLTISSESTRLAVEWVQYLESVAEDILIEDNEGEIDHSIVLSEKIANKIASGTITNGCTVRELKSKFRGKMDKAHLVDTLEMLRENGWIEIQSIKTSGRPKKCLFINPSLLKSKTEQSDAKPFCTTADVTKTPFTHESCTKDVVDFEVEKPFCGFCDADLPDGQEKTEQENPVQLSRKENTKGVTKVTKGRVDNINSNINKILPKNKSKIEYVTKGVNDVTKGHLSLLQKLDDLSQKVKADLTASDLGDLAEALSILPIKTQLSKGREFMNRFVKDVEGAWAWLVSVTTKCKCEIEC